MNMLIPRQKNIFILSTIYQNILNHSSKIKCIYPRPHLLNNQLRSKYHTVRTLLPMSYLPTWSVARTILFQNQFYQTVTDNNSKLLKMYLASLLQEFNVLEAEVNENQPKKVSPMTKRYVELMPIAFKIRELKAKTDELGEIEEFLCEVGSADKELKSAAEQEKADCINDINTLESEVKTLLSVNNEDEINEIILEILPGVGGQESQVFAQEMFLMYENYANYRDWSFLLLTDSRTEIGGVRKASAIITGENVYKYLKFEGGVHRVQRIPVTERSGRVHTSTVTVAILPQPKEIDITLSPKDLQITTCRASGSGGQHVNTTDSAVRIVHLPTGISAESQQERSQIKNKELAMKLLKSRIYQKQLKAQEEEVKSSRKLQVGTAGRSEKIRTYNFNQDRITDHRIGCNVFNISQFFIDGQLLDSFIRKLHEAEEENILSQKLEEFSLSISNNAV